jgi:hypothetical protein
MKFIGFLNVHDSMIECSKEIDDFSFSSKSYTKKTEDVAITLAYLEHGTVLLKLISPLYDIDDEYIGSNIIYTDGVWVWPSYFSFYLKKYPCVKIHKEFINHIQIHQNRPLNLSIAQLNYVEFMYAKINKIKSSITQDMAKKIQPFLDCRGDDIECY